MSSHPLPPKPPLKKAPENAVEKAVQPQRNLASRGLLSVQPPAPGTVTLHAAPGLFALGLDGDRDGFLFVPKAVREGRPVPLVVMLHGAGGDAGQSLSLLKEEAEERGLAILAPDSRGSSWDFIRGGFGPDVEFIRRALELTFSKIPVDPGHLAIAGFSDGASYALSLGLANGNLFSHVIAYSPGFESPPSARGHPRIFISHGTLDTVLPIDRCSRVIVLHLREEGYEVRYREYLGIHAIPPSVLKEGLSFFHDSNR